MEYSKQPAFINRQQEIKFLGNWIAEKPNVRLNYRLFDRYRRPVASLEEVFSPPPSEQ